eukprot:5744304-Lingulodinium_polyedra.AAC.1
MIHQPALVTETTVARLPIAPHQPTPVNVRLKLHLPHTSSLSRAGPTQRARTTTLNTHVTTSKKASLP